MDTLSMDTTPTLNKINREEPKESKIFKVSYQRNAS